MPFYWFGKKSFVPYTKVSRFADELKDGKLTGSRCRKCGNVVFPPRADCGKCMSDDFELMEYSGDAILHTYTQIHAAPTGFEDMGTYLVGIVDLPEGGRLLGWIEGLDKKDIKIGMKMKVIPKIFDEIEEIKVYYTLEKS